MSTTSFDTLGFSETLREAGMPEAQAKALSHALQNQFVSELVTKQDLRSAVDELRVEFRSETQSLRTELQSEIRSSRTELQSEIQSSRTELQAEIQSSRDESRSGLQLCRAEFRSEIQLLRADIRQLEQKLTIRLGAIVVVALGAFTTLSKLIA